MYVPLCFFNQNNFLFLLQQHLFSDDMFTGVFAHMRSTNSKAQRSNQFLMDKIKSWLTFFMIEKLFHSDVTKGKKGLLTLRFETNIIKM